MLTVGLWVVGEDRSRHSPNRTEAKNITSVVTMATSRLSRTLGIKRRQPVCYAGRRPAAGRDGPDEPGFGVDVPHSILGQALVHAVEERPQQAAHHAHQDEEAKVHCCPQVAFLFPV